MLASLWYLVAHNALRPWLWFVVALASLVVLPTVEITAPVDGVVAEVGESSVDITPVGEGAAPVTVTWDTSGDWHPEAKVAAGDELGQGDVVARTDSERAYPVMMVRYLPMGLLGLVVASLFAAFMSTIDTHVNLASSFFVNDIYRRFLRSDAEPRHYVTVARLASAGVLALACLLVLVSDSIGDLFTFFLAFLGGVGPVYVLRWLWWRVRAATEITAMVASSVAAVTLTFLDVEWDLGPLSDGGDLTDGGRLILVVMISLTASLLSLVFTKEPDPRQLVDFYRRVRPMGWWRQVRVHCRDVVPPREEVPVLAGVTGALCATYGLLFGIGHVIFGRTGETLIAFAAFVAGIGLVIWALRQIEFERRA